MCMPRPSGAVHAPNALNPSSLPTPHTAVLLDLQPRGGRPQLRLRHCLLSGRPSFPAARPPPTPPHLLPHFIQLSHPTFSCGAAAAQPAAAPCPPLRSAAQPSAFQAPPPPGGLAVPASWIDPLLSASRPSRDCSAPCRPPAVSCLSMRAAATRRRLAATFSSSAAAWVRRG